MCAILPVMPEVLHFEATRSLYDSREEHIATLVQITAEVLDPSLAGDWVTIDRGTVQEPRVIPLLRVRGDTHRVRSFIDSFSDGDELDRKLTAKSPIKDLEEPMTVYLRRLQAHFVERVERVDRYVKNAVEVRENLRRPGTRNDISQSAHEFPPGDRWRTWDIQQVT